MKRMNKKEKAGKRERKMYSPNCSKTSTTYERRKPKRYTLLNYRDIEV